MRFLLLAPMLLAACSDGPAPPAPPAEPLRLSAFALEDGMRVDVDGRMAEDAWSHAPELRVPLAGKGPAEVKLRAAHDGRRLYLLAVWPDAAASQGRYWRYEGDLKWSRFETEDAFAVMWGPGALAAEFRAQGCGLSCHDGRHVYPGTGSGLFDCWYWGAQQTQYAAEARDMWIRRGDDQRLRGDGQPADSDNVPNVSAHYEGPSLFPTFRRKGDDRVVMFGPGLKEVTPDWIRRYWDDKVNTGREVPLDLLRGRRGSRGDVRAAARHHEGKAWVVEMARDFETGNADDLPFGDPLVPARLAVAVFDDAGGADHAVSGPIELHFLPAQ